MSLVESLCLLCSHVFPNTRHTRTRSCLVCRHLYNNSVQTHHKTVSCVTGVTSLSENDLLNTGRTRVGKYFTCIGVGRAKEVEIGLYLSRIQMSALPEVPHNLNILLMVFGPEVDTSVIHSYMARASKYEKILILAYGGDVALSRIILYIRRCRTVRGHLLVFRHFQAMRPVLWRLCTEGGRTSAAQMMRSGVLVHTLFLSSCLEEPLLV